jgi:hypothetical protein
MSTGRLSAWIAVLAGAILAVAGPAYSDTPPTLKSVTIEGDPVVGMPLHAVVEWTGDPAPSIEYEWARCDPERHSKCEAIEGAITKTYVPAEADEGSPLIVRVATNSPDSDEKKSKPTAPVRPAPEPTPEPMPPPEPAPTQEPAPTPQPAPTPEPAPTPLLASTAPPAATAPTVAPALRYLLPFPVVRIRGSIAARGAVVTLLRVTAPRAAAVSVRCAGDGCPIRRRTRGDGRIRALERFLPAGVRIAIRVHRRGYIGKYVHFRIRAGKPPARRDACVLSASSPPVACPTA